jgi:hypothetical protein
VLSALHGKTKITVRAIIQTIRFFRIVLPLLLTEPDKHLSLNAYKNAVEGRFEPSLGEFDETRAMIEWEHIDLMNNFDNHIAPQRNLRSPAFELRTVEHLAAQQSLSRYAAWNDA